MIKIGDPSQRKEKSCFRKRFFDLQSGGEGSACKARLAMSPLDRTALELELRLRLEPSLTLAWLARTHTRPGPVPYLPGHISNSLSFPIRWPVAVGGCRAMPCSGLSRIERLDAERGERGQHHVARYAPTLAWLLVCHLPPPCVTLALRSGTARPCQGPCDPGNPALAPSFHRMFCFFFAADLVYLSSVLPTEDLE